MIYSYNLFNDCQKIQKKGVDVIFLITHSNLTNTNHIEFSDNGTRRITKKIDKSFDTGSENRLSLNSPATLLKHTFVRSLKSSLIDFVTTPQCVCPTHMGPYFTNLLKKMHSEFLLLSHRHTQAICSFLSRLLVSCFENESGRAVAEIEISK